MANRYKWPTADGRLAVSNVHVDRTSHPVSAFFSFASARVLVKIACNLWRGGLGREFGCLSCRACLIAGVSLDISSVEVSLATWWREYDEQRGT